MADIKRVEISDKLKVAALLNLNKLFDAFKKHAKTHESLSGFVLAIAAEAMAESGGTDPMKGAELFDTAAKHAQRAFQQEHKTPEGDVVPMEVLCPAWSPRKSSVLRNMRKGVDPRDYPSLTEMTKARIAVTKESGRGRQERSESGDDGDETQVTLPDNVAEAVKRLYKAIGAAASIKHLEDALIATLAKTAEEIESLYLSSGESDGDVEQVA